MRYSAKVLHYFNDPTHVGILPEDSLSVGTGKVGTLASGDVVQLQIEVHNNSITAAKFQAQASPVTIAVCAWMSEWLLKKPLTTAQTLSKNEIMLALELPVLKQHCILLVVQALQIALADYASKQLKQTHPY